MFGILFFFGLNFCHQQLSCWKLSESLTLANDEHSSSSWPAHLGFLQEGWHLSIRSWQLSERCTYFTDTHYFSLNVFYTLHVLFLCNILYSCVFNSIVVTKQTQTYLVWWLVQITLSYLRIRQKYRISFLCFKLLNTKNTSFLFLFF